MSSNRTPGEDWLGIHPTDEPDILSIHFQEHHLGNPLIRSIHGGVVGALVEHTAVHVLQNELAQQDKSADLEVTTTTLEYLRVTKDADLFARATITRLARRVAFMSVFCWQDDPETPIAHGNCTIRIL